MHDRIRNWCIPLRLVFLFSKDRRHSDRFKDTIHYCHLTSSADPSLQHRSHALLTFSSMFSYCPMPLASILRLPFTWTLGTCSMALSARSRRPSWIDCESCVATTAMAGLCPRRIVLCMENC
ncbi:hypothetical protein BO86DRAFT_90965 [Aspergillus japonicus CBS 114.51]|uniref:Uncharacterized protein n=1 Tax=Aspergillus japonicus CBS 114.51 TaxID=1448312 RepID=A0A8T8X188_ASPJA|nr:hypothetical protein BO86DRAFT_90965 [Aspergillus japonicus CBS 114.51]RAH81907.1 hypothetical protein BO86DRAFT_90965 [Aspergillus japonicus CBS 114.51]